MTDEDGDRSLQEVATRIAELQRTAYGAGASETERQAAAAELERLHGAEADAAAAREARSALAVGGTPGPPPHGLAVDASDTAEAAAFAPLAVSERTDARGIRWAIAAGVVALGLGLGIGWQVGGRSVPPPSEAVTTADPGALAAIPTVPATVPLSETSMVASLDRAQVDSDLLDPEFMQRYLLDGESARRLLSAPDGLVVYSAVRDGDLCLIASWTAGAEDGAPACTTGQIVNGKGLRTTVMSEATVTAVHWRRDGTVELTPVGERVAEPATADDAEGAE
jgi:hypothetical protein